MLRSWRAPRAVEYHRLERLERLEHLVGTAVTVQAMVFGNLGAASGSGVGFTRDPATGADRLYFDFLVDAQGEDVVAGRRRAGVFRRLAETVPGLPDGLEGLRRTLESVFGDAQDFELTVEDRMLWLLQTRTAKRTPWAALQIVCDLVTEGCIDEATALERLAGYDLETIVRGRLAVPAETRPLALATRRASGSPPGGVAFQVEDARRRGRGTEVVLVRESASTRATSPPWRSVGDSSRRPGPRPRARGGGGAPARRGLPVERDLVARRKGLAPEPDPCRGTTRSRSRRPWTGFCGYVGGSQRPIDLTARGGRFARVSSPLAPGVEPVIADSS